MNPYASYIRVSTDRQGQSGLGLEAQRNAVREYLDGQEPHAEFVEIESGSKHDRPQLAVALAYCREHRCTLLIARLDRLSRSVHFVSGLMESGVEFKACDMPHATEFMLHVYSAVAQEERRLISERTKAALRAAKERGVVLGKHGKQLRREAVTRAESLADIVLALRERGYTLRAIAAHLTENGIPTPKGGRWHPTSVKNVLERL